MGTRADFYVGRGKSAEWIGSVAYDGMDLEDEVRDASDEATYRLKVGKELDSREDSTLPEQGWPCPWNDSNTSDYSYAFEDGVVWVANGQHPWYNAKTPPDFNEDEDLLSVQYEFPDMAEKKKVTMGPRSGLLVFSVPQT